MTRIIKSGSVSSFGSVRPLHQAAQSTHVEADERNTNAETEAEFNYEKKLVEAREVSAKQVHELESAHAALAEKYKHAKEEIEKVRAEAFEKGKAAGLKDAEVDEQGRHERIAKTLQAALTLLSQRLESIDALAAMLAQAGLAKIFDDHDDLAALVASAISKRIRQIKDETILAVVVSQEDFPDPQTARKQIPNLQDDVEIRCDAALKSGDCRIKLSLGVLEIGPELQIGRLKELLQQLAEGA